MIENEGIWPIYIIYLLRRSKRHLDKGHDLVFAMLFQSVKKSLSILSSMCTPSVAASPANMELTRTFCFVDASIFFATKIDAGFLLLPILDQAQVSFLGFMRLKEACVVDVMSSHYQHCYQYWYDRALIQPNCILQDRSKNNIHKLKVDGAVQDLSRENRP